MHQIISSNYYKFCIIDPFQITIIRRHPVKPVKKLWKAIADDIKEDIISGRYKPLSRLREAELAEKYRVSKTPVREAIRYLEGIGFLEIIPHTMVRVTRMDKKGASELYRITALLEGMVIRDTIPNLTARDYAQMAKQVDALETHYREKQYRKYEKANISFHSIIWKRSGNEKFNELNKNIREQLQRFRSVTRRYPEKFVDIVADHRKILELVKKKDLEEAERFVRRHFEKSGEIIVNLLENENAFS